MALMNTTVFEGYADRIAKQYSYIKTAFDTLAVTASGTQYYARVTATGDSDVELAMLNNCYNADAFFEGNTTISAVQGMTHFTALITAFESHLVREASLSTRTWDTYCADQDVRVSDYTNQVYYARNGSYMNASNVFCEDDTLFGDGAVTGASAITFTAGDDFGDGNSANKADGTAYAGTQLKFVVTGAQTISGLTVDIIGTDEAGGAQTLSDVAIDGAPSVEGNIGTSADKWLSVTGITVTGSTGVASDEFELRNVVERTIAL